MMKKITESTGVTWKKDYFQLQKAVKKDIDKCWNNSTH